MKSIFKKFIVSVATVICTVCAFAGAFVSFNDDKSVVRAETTVAESDFWVSNAEIRLINDEYGAGIRFRTYMTDSVYDSLTVKSSGTLMIPEHLYDGELTLEDMDKVSAQRPVKADTTGKWDSATYEDEAVMKSTAYIYNLPAKGFGWRMVVRSYVELDDGSVVYSSIAKASISDVAKAVYDTTTDAHLQFQTEPFIVESVNVTIVDLYGNSSTSTVAYGSKLVVPETCKIHTGSAYEVNFYDAKGNKWDVENGEFTRDTALTAKMEQREETKTVANAFLSTAGNSSVWIKVLPNDDLAGETAPAGFTQVTRFDPKTEQVVEHATQSDVWSSGGLGANHFNINVANYSEVSFALKVVGGAYLCNMKGWYSFSSANWIYFHLTQNEDATWNIKITSGGEIITLKDSNENTQEGSYTNQNATYIDVNRPAGSLSTILYDNGASSADGAGMTIYGPGTIYSTEIIGVEKLDPESYPPYDAVTVVDSFFYGDTNVSWRNFKTGAVTTEVDAPEGFNVVTKFEVKDGVKEDDDGKNVTLGGTYWDQTTYENYSEVWFAVKGTDLKTNKQPDYDQKVWTDWVYFHLTQTSAGVWTIEVTVNGQQLYLAENQVATETASYQPEGSLQAILTGAFTSDTDGFAIRIDITGSDAVFYTTEVLAIGEGDGDPVLPDYDAGVVAEHAFGTWLGTNAVENTDLGDVTAPDGFSYVKRFDSSAGWSDVLASATAFNYGTVMTDYREIWFAYKLENCYIQRFSDWGNLVGDQLVYFHLIQTGTDADDGATLWTIEISNEAGTVVGRYTNQRGVSADISTADTLAAIFYNGFNATKCTDGQDFRFRKTDTSKSASFYCTEVKAIRKDGGEIEDVELPSQGGSTTEGETASYKVKLIDSAAGAWLGTNLVVNADTSAVTTPDGFKKVTRYDAGSDWTTGTLTEVSSFNGNIKLDSYSEVWFAYQFVDCKLQSNWSEVAFTGWVYFHLTQEDDGEWTIEITNNGEVWGTYENQSPLHNEDKYDNTVTAILYGGFYNKTRSDDGQGFRVRYGDASTVPAIYASEILAKPKAVEANAMASSTATMMASPVRTDFTDKQSGYAQIKKNADLNGVTAPAGFKTVTRLDAMAKWSTANAVLSSGANSWVANDFASYGEIWFAMKGDNVSFGLDTSSDIITDGWALYRLTQTSDGVWTVELSIDGNSLATAEKTVVASNLYDFGIRVKALADEGVSLYVTEVRATQTTWGKRAIWSAMDYSKPSTVVEAPYGFTQVYERTSFNDYFAKMSLANTEYTQLRFAMLPSGNLYIDDAKTTVISKKLDNTSTMFLVTLDRTAEGWTVSMDTNVWSSANGTQAFTPFTSTGNSLYEIFKDFACWSGVTVYTTEVRGEHTHVHAQYISTGAGTHRSVCFCGETIATETCSGTVATCTELAVCSTCNTAFGALDADNHTQGTTTIVNGDDTHTIKYLCCEEVVETTSCSGGTATCTELAVCSVCNDTYGDYAHTPTWVKGEYKCTLCDEVFESVREEAVVSGTTLLSTTDKLVANDDLGDVTAPEGYTTIRRYDEGTWTSGVLQDFDTTDISGYRSVRFAWKVIGATLITRSATGNWNTISDGQWVFFELTQNDNGTWNVVVYRENGTVLNTLTDQVGSNIKQLTYDKGNSTDGGFADTENGDMGTIYMNHAGTVTFYTTEILGWKKHDHFVDYYTSNQDGTHDGVCFCGYVVEDNVACSGDADDGCDIVCENCNTVYGEEHVGTLAWNEDNEYVCDECGEIVASVTTEIGSQYFVLNTDATSLSLDGSYRGGTTAISFAEAFSDTSYTITSATFNGSSTTATKGDEFDVKISKAGITNSVYGEGYEVTLTVEFYGETFTITAPVIVVTNKITTDAGMQNMKNVLHYGSAPATTAMESNSMMGEGYYLLGANVTLTSNTVYTFGTKTVPFVGTFDGNGYTVSNYSTLKWFTNDSNHVYQDNAKDYNWQGTEIDTYQAFLDGSFFGVLDGTVKNVAFTNLRIGIYSNLVHSGSGLIENVYVRPYGIQSHVTTYTSMFFTKGDRNGAGTLRNVVIDLAGQANNINIYNSGNTSYLNPANFSNPATNGLFPAAIGRNFSAQNVAIYGFAYDYATSTRGNVYLNASGVATDGRESGIYATYANLDGTARAQGEPTDNGGYFAISQLDETIWKVVNGVPVLKNCTVSGTETALNAYQPVSSPNDPVIYNSATGETEYYFAWDWSATSQTTFDAYALINNYAYLSTGVALKAGTLDLASEGYKQIVVGTYEQYGQYLDNTLEIETDTRANYGIYVENQTIYVLGETDEAIMYAAKALANKLYGYKEVAADDYKYDDLSQTTISLISDYETAIAFSMRGGGNILPTKDGNSTDTINQNKMGFTTEYTYTAYEEMHNSLNYFYDFSSGSTVLKSGYTGTANNIASSTSPTGQTAQLCYLRELDTKASWVASVIQAQYNADKTIECINFMVEDNSYYCTCDSCKKFSNPSIPQLIFLNAVATKLDTLNVPVAIEFLAYNQFQSSPVLTTNDETALGELSVSYDTATVTLSDGTTATVLKAHNDLRLQWTSHKLYHSFELTHPMNKEFYDYLLGWVATMGGGDKINLFLYQTFYRDYFLPMNTWRYQVSWYKTFNALGINNYVSNLGVTPWTVGGQRMTPNTQTSFNAFKAYIDSRAQTDANVTYEQLKAEFFSTSGYYGEAGPTMLLYFNELEASMEARKTGGENAFYSPANTTDWATANTALHWKTLEANYSLSDADKWNESNFNGRYNMNGGMFKYETKNVTYSYGGITGGTKGATVKGRTDLYTTGDLTQKATLEQWYGYCQTALGLVDADSAYAKRIKVEALFPEYAFLTLHSTYVTPLSESSMKNGTAVTSASLNVTSTVFGRSYQQFYDYVTDEIGVVRLAEFYTLDSKEKPADTAYEGHCIYSAVVDCYLYASPFKNWGVTF